MTFVIAVFVYFIKRFFDYIKPLLKSYPDNVVLHIGTNDSVNNSWKTILNNGYLEKGKRGIENGIVEWEWGIAINT